MSVEPFEAGVTAFMLVKTTPEWLGLSVDQRVEAFTTDPYADEWMERSDYYRCGNHSTIPAPMVHEVLMM